MHLGTILDRIAALKAMLTRTEAAAYKTQQKESQFTQAQRDTLDAQYDIIEDCLYEMGNELPEMDGALDTIEPINNSGLLG